MASADVRSTLTVYYDGQFWVALVERENDGMLEVARHVFGPEPSLPEIEALVNGPGWSHLHFMPAGSLDTRDTALPANPKRRQREAARQAQGARALHEVPRGTAGSPGGTEAGVGRLEP